MTASRLVGAVAVIAASIVLLSGCAEPRRAPPSGLSAQELAEYNDYIGQRLWQSTGLPDSLRPEVTAEFVEPEEWTERLGSCGDRWETVTSVGEQAAIITEYRCRMSYQLTPGVLSLLNTAQLDYLYDYYQDTLVPCLRIRGVEVPEVLSREEAVDVGRFSAYPWNPYSEMSDATRDGVRDSTTWAACPPFPPDAVFDRYWER